MSIISAVGSFFFEFDKLDKYHHPMSLDENHMIGIWLIQRSVTAMNACPIYLAEISGL